MEAIFFPRKDYDVEVCAHRLGKKMTYTDQTDTLGTSTSYNSYMALAKARSIKVGCFIRYDDFALDFYQTAKEDIFNGSLWVDQYSMCPSLSEKILSGETITEQEWNYAYANELLPVFFENIGKKPIALSYSHGVQNFRDYVLPKYLVARGSVPSGQYDHQTYPTDYGNGHGSPDNVPYSVQSFKSRASSIRWYDAARYFDNDFSGQLTILSNLIDATMLNGGWVNNFTHWHNYYSQGNQSWAEAYLDLLASKNSNDEICFSGYGESVAYMVYRDMITRAVMYSPVKHAQNQLIIRLETNNDIFQVDTDLLQVPISIKFSTANTPLEGLSIRCKDRNLISLGNNQYIVEIPFGRFPCAVIEAVSN